MTNILLELIEHKIEHFITKSFITCDFESDESRSEYHVYYKIQEKAKTSPKNAKNLSPKDYVGFYNKRSVEFPYLKYKKLQKVEIKFLNNNSKEYVESFSDENGSVYIHKEVGFVKEKSS